METCARGFSFVPENEVVVIDLQYIEGVELEKTWKATLRQRNKRREQMVWDEFIKEQDVVHALCKDDPYQFLEQLPDACLKELMEVELEKMRIEHIQEETNDQLPPTDSPARVEEIQHTVTFADEEDKGDDDETYFQIFDSEKDDEVSGPEDEVLNGSVSSPCTVRENCMSPNSQRNIKVDSDKSSENVASLVESSIYCGKVKELRIRVNEELCTIMSWLENQDVLNQEPEEIVRMCKRSSEFSTRFNRIYMYQLHRQLNDIKRNSNVTLPFARHTQFQSQMLRIVSLHQQLMHCYQVFRKSLPQTGCVRDTADTLCNLLRATRDVSATCGSTPAPSDFAPVVHLYDDIVLTNCDKIQNIVEEYNTRFNDFLEHTENNNLLSSKKKGKGKKRYFGLNSKTGSVSEAEARLSMYSLDTMRLNLQARSTSSKDNHSSSGTSKIRGVNSSTRIRKRANKTEAQPKSPKKSPRNRRPLMRDPQAGKPRALRVPRDTDIRTMVEAVGTCTSSHISREGSLTATPRPRQALPETITPRGRTCTPRTPHTQPLTSSGQRKSQTAPSCSKIRVQSPKAKNRRISPKVNKRLKIALGSIKNDLQDSECSGVQITSVSKIQSAKKDVKVGKSDDDDDSFQLIEKVNNGERNKKNSTDSGTKIMHNKTVDDIKLNDTIQNSNVDTVEDVAKVKHSGESSRRQTPRMQNNEKENGREQKTARPAPSGCDVTRLLKQFCSGDSSGVKNERVCGSKNVQLLCINGGSPRQPSTPQLLRILEETIKKKSPKPLYQKQMTSVKDFEKYRLVFNITDKTAENLFSYRKKFVQHMLTSPMYANSAVGKPWEMIGSISENIIDDLLLGIAKNMEIQDVVQQLYDCETR